MGIAVGLFARDQRKQSDCFRIAQSCGILRAVRQDIRLHDCPCDVQSCDHGVSSAAAVAHLQQPHRIRQQASNESPSSCIAPCIPCLQIRLVNWLPARCALSPRKRFQPVELNKCITHPVAACGRQHKYIHETPSHFSTPSASVYAPAQLASRRAAIWGQVLRQSCWIPRAQHNGSRKPASK
jgi:hypothetical protein